MGRWRRPRRRRRTTVRRRRRRRTTTMTMMTTTTRRSPRRCDQPRSLSISSCFSFEALSEVWTETRQKADLHMVVERVPFSCVGERLFVDHSLQPVELRLLVGHLLLKLTEISICRLTGNDVNTTLINGLL